MSSHVYQALAGTKKVLCERFRIELELFTIKTDFYYVYFSQQIEGSTWIERTTTQTAISISYFKS